MVKFLTPCKRHFLVIIGLLIWLQQGWLQASEFNPDQLMASAKSQQLWQMREWQVLLHYSPDWVGAGVTSLIDDPEFFLSPEGKNSPQSELLATLAELFKPAKTGDQSLFCRFPARLTWLEKVLHFDMKALTKSHCKKFNNWLKAMSGDGITLIFPVSVLNSPASMFGHTFLRIDRKTTQKPDLLAWTISYAAHAEQEKGVMFAFKGLTGGYQGKFSISPYHARVKEYTDLESRDMWEYQLALGPEQVHALLLHLWELLPVYFDYYFIDENCAYQLLALLEAANPELNLVRHFQVDAIPAETVKAITRAPGFLKNVQFRPSNEKLITARAARLSAGDRELAKRIGAGELAVTAGELIERPEIVQAQIVELAYAYLAYQIANEKQQKLVLPEAGNDSQRKSLLYTLLSARSRLRIPSQKPNIPMPTVRPDQGHDGHRLGLQAGYEQPWNYQQLDIRWTYHDLYDPSQGFANGAQLEFFKPSFRYFPDKNRLQLESIDLVNIISMPPRTDFIRPFSWEISAAVRRHRIDANHRPLMGDFKAGVGLSYPLTRTSQIGMFINTGVLVSDQFKQWTAIAGGGRVEALWQVTSTWQIGLYAKVLRYFFGNSQTAYSFGLKQQLSLSQNQSLVAEIAETRDLGEAFLNTQIGWYYYF